MAAAALFQSANDSFAAKDNGVERTVGLGNTPADFTTATAVTITVDGSLTGFNDDTSCELDAWVETSGGTLLASDASTWKQIQSRSSNGSFTTSALSFSTINTTATKTDWDGAVIRYRQSITGISMGPDSVAYTTTTTTQVDVTYTPAAVPDDLLADDVESASEVTSPAITQEHALLPNDVESASEVSAPDLGQDHTLTATSVESASEVSAPGLSQVVPLLANDVESLSEGATPAIGQQHTLLADDATSATGLTDPQVAQAHALLVVGVESASGLTTPTLFSGTGGVDILSPQPVVSASEVSIPSLGLLSAEISRGCSANDEEEEIMALIMAMSVRDSIAALRR